MSEINLLKSDIPNNKHKTRPNSTKTRTNKISTKSINIKNVPFNRSNILRFSLDKIRPKKNQKESIILSLLMPKKIKNINKADDYKIINEEKEIRKLLEEDEIKLKDLEEKINQQKKIMEEKNNEINKLKNNSDQLTQSIKEKENSIEQIKREINDFKEYNEEISNFINNFSQNNNILNAFGDLNDLDNYPNENEMNDSMENSNNPLYPNVDQMTYEQILELEEQIGNISNGLTDEEMKNLKREKYIKYKYLDDKCIICQYVFKELETIVVFSCKHCFHFPCIKPWLSTQHHCPLCKKDIKEK